MNDSSNLKDLQAAIRDFVDARDWKKFHNPKDLAMSLVLESTELMELFQWKNSEEVDEYARNNINEISDELADVLYWVLLMSNKLDIDITSAFYKKLSKNAEKYPVEKSYGNHKKYTELK